VVNGFNHWINKGNQFSVQPPLSLLENIFTLRVHLDDTTRKNGALKVIPGSHKMGICRPETIDTIVHKEEICEVPKGGVMIMKPLLLHSSGRTTNGLQRRVIHLEFSNIDLPSGIKWAEREEEII
jgi:ectoine hydroxylase-related dioxygenase (phytanoyl-CoA dioxygenase family)